MSEIQDKLKVATESAVIAGEETGLALKNFYTTMARWQKYFFVIGILLILPVYFGSYYISKAVTTKQLEQNLLSAHVAYKENKNINLGEVKILKTGEGVYTTYFQVINPNLDLVSPMVGYEIELFNSKKEKIKTVSGNFFLLPDQTKTVINSRIQTTEELSSAKLIVDEVEWQKRLDIPKVSFRTPEPLVFDQTTIVPPQLVVEGSVVNESEYTLGKISITFMLYDTAGQLVGIASREERNIAAFGRRAYKQLWPNLTAEQIGKVVVSVDVNTLEKSNINFSSTEGVPVSSLPELN